MSQDHARLTTAGVRWISAKLNKTANQTPTDRNGLNTNQTKLGKLNEIYKIQMYKCTHMQIKVQPAFQKVCL